MIKKLKPLVQIKEFCLQRPFLWLGVPVGTAMVCVPLILAQAFSNPQTTNSQTTNPQTTAGSTPLPPPGVGQNGQASRSLPPDLFSKASLLNQVDPLQSPRSTKSAPSNPQTGAQLPGQSRSARPSQPPNATPISPPPAKLRPVPPSQGAVPEIRVAISFKEGSTNIQDRKFFSVGAATPTPLVDDQGRVLGTLPANQGVYAQVNAQGLQVGSLQASTSVWVEPERGGLFFLDGRWYRGRLRLLNLNGGLVAVNYVDLEQYLTSVVGSEVYPSWPMDVLKAQAIAARSYALAHALQPHSSYFDLGNTQRWQVYRGIETEWNTSDQAVKATRGLVLSRSGSVVLSMYAASDDIVREVFGGRGMSQRGAYQLAQRGYNYLQILGTYYPGSGLAQIRLQ